MLSEMTHDWPKIPHDSLNPEPRRGAESSVLSDHLNFKMLRGYYDKLTNFKMIIDNIFGLTLLL